MTTSSVSELPEVLALIVATLASAALTLLAAWYGDLVPFCGGLALFILCRMIARTFRRAD